MYIPSPNNISKIRANHNKVSHVEIPQVVIIMVIIHSTPSHYVNYNIQDMHSKEPWLCTGLYLTINRIFISDQSSASNIPSYGENDSIFRENTFKTKYLIDFLIQRFQKFIFFLSFGKNW